MSGLWITEWRPRGATPDDAAMSHSEFGHKLRRICPHKPTRRGLTTRRTVRRDTPPHPTIELLWTGPGPGDDETA